MKGAYKKFSFAVELSVKDMFRGDAEIVSGTANWISAKLAALAPKHLVETIDHLSIRYKHAND